MKTIIRSIAIFLAFSWSSAAQNVKTIQTVRTDLQSIINNATSNYGMEGIELSLIYDDQQATETFYAGIRAPGLAVDSNKPWHYAQAVAGYVNYVALKLIEEGKMTMNDNIGAHLDATAMGLDGDITVRELIRHTSVLEEYWNPGAAAGCYQDIWTLNPTQLGCPEDLISCFPANKLSPGAYDQSNTNLLVLQFLIDSVSGHSYETEIQNRIFTPMGMNESYLSTCKQVTIDSINGIWTTNSGYANNHSYTRYFSTNGANRSLIAKSYEVAQFYHALFQGNLVGTAVLDSVMTIIPGSEFPQGSYGCASDIRGYAGYNTDIIRVIDNDGDTSWLYGKGGFGMNGHLTFHDPAHGYTISFAHNDRTRMLEHRNLAMDLFCYLNDIDSISSSSASVGLKSSPLKTMVVYPNPAKDYIKLDLPYGASFGSLRIVDLGGRTVLEQSELLSNEIDLSALPRGLYLLHLEGDQEVYQARIVKG
jgi:CubicO group peptidase (beta-lactamase class C family)